MRSFFRFTRLIALDIRLGCWYVLAGVVALSAVSVLLLSIAYGRVSSFGIDVIDLTWADNIALIFGGNPPFDFRPGVMYVPPFGWLLLCALLLGTTLLYPMNGFPGWACKTVLDAGSRKAWWLAKCAWVAYGSLTAIAGVCTFVLVWTLLWGQELSFSLHARSMLLLGADAGQVHDGVQSVFPFLTGIILTVIALSEAQLALALIVRTPFAFVAMLGFMVAGAYRQEIFLPGNALMSVRWDQLVIGGVGASGSTAFAVTVMAISVGIGTLLFSALDFSSKERGE